MNRFPLITALLLATLLPTSGVQAEEHPTGYTTRLTGDTLIRIKGERVTLAFRIDLGEQLVRRQHRRIVTPVIAAADGTRSLQLPAVVLNGRTRAIKQQRDARPQSDTLAVYATLDPKAGDQSRYVDYRATADYEPWMEQARLLLREQVTGCACGDLLTADQVVTSPLLHAPDIRLGGEQECPVEYTPRREERDAYLIYAVNRTDLHADQYGNSRELQKIDSALTYVKHNPSYEIQRIEIAGYASPEGRYDANVRLAEGRANALKEYILGHYNLPDTLLTIRPGDENWDGLREALAGYDLPHKDEILRTISEVSDPDQREAAIRRIGGGQPYQTLLHAIYPSLRKNTFAISYISRERTPEEARQLVLTNPGELNVHEFQTVARRFYADDPDAYLRVLRTAAETYPNHSISNANAALACLRAGLIDEAEHYLMRTGNEPYTWNTRACLLWQQERKQEAIRWWRQAADAGDPDAAHNLAELEKRISF